MSRKKSRFIIFSLGTCIIGSPRKQITLFEHSIPAFLRCDNVEISFCSPHLEAELNFIQNQMLLLKSALTDSNAIEFFVRLDKSSTGWDPHYAFIQGYFLEYIRDRLLPICNSSRRYEFIIHFYSVTEEVITNVITSLLQMPEIKQCSNIGIGISIQNNRDRIKMQLPIEEISNWLEKPAEGKGINSQSQKERFLRIIMSKYRVRNRNALEMIDHLKTVFFIHKPLKMSKISLNLTPQIC